MSAPAPGRLLAAGTAGWLFTGLAAAFGIVLLLVLVLRPLLLLLIVAVALATIAAPLADALVARRVPRTIAALLCCVLLIGVVAGTIVIVIAGLASQWDQVAATLSAAGERLIDIAEGMGVSPDQAAGAQQAVTDATPVLMTGLLSGLAEGVLAAAQIVLGTVFGLYVLFFLLNDPEVARGAVVTVLPLPRPVADEALARSARLVRRYFAGMTVIGVANAVVVAVGALILGVPLVGAIALVTFLLAYVPYVGAFVSGAFAVLIALGSGGTETALWMLLVVILANGSLQNLLQPFAFGTALHLHPLAVLLATALAGLVAGVAGVILAAPLTAITVDVVRLIRQEKASTPAATPDRPPRAGADPGPADRGPIETGYASG